MNRATDTTPPITLEPGAASSAASGTDGADLPRLGLGEGPAPAGSSALVLGVIVVVVVGMLSGWCAYRRIAMPARERALRAVARRAGLKGADRAALAALARACGAAHPVALCVSRTGLARALREHPGVVDARAARRLRERLIEAP